MGQDTAFYLRTSWLQNVRVTMTSIFPEIIITIYNKTSQNNRYFLDTNIFPAVGVNDPRLHRETTSSVRVASRHTQNPKAPKARLFEKTESTTHDDRSGSRTPSYEAVICARMFDAPVSSQMTRAGIISASVVTQSDVRSRSCVKYICVSWTPQNV